MHEFNILINLKDMFWLCGARSASIEEIQWHRHQLADIVLANFIPVPEAHSTYV